MYIDDKDSLKLAQYGMYEPDETRFIQDSIGTDFVVVDIGANIGYYTLIMASLAKEVHAFEPDPVNYGILQKNVTANNLTNVVTYNKAVSEAAEKRMLYVCDFNRGMHRLYPSRYCRDSIDVDAVRLDEVIHFADFIKMDIEGAELGALRGMTRLLEKGPTLLMEFHPPSIREYGANPRDVIAYVQSFGYRVMLPDHDHDDVIYEELEKLATEKAGTNILCIRK